MTDALIGIIEDYRHARTDLKGIAADMTGDGRADLVKIPTKFSDTERLFLFYNLDGLLIDVNLHFWDLSKRIIKRIKGVGQIKDGIDLANLAFRLFKNSKDAIYIYSSEVDLTEPKYAQKLARLPFDPTTVVISNSGSFHETMQQYFRSLLEKAQISRAANPLLQPPDFFNASLSHRIHAFKSVYFSSADWANVHFDVVGDYAWMVVCGHKVELDYYGFLLGERKHNEFGIRPLRNYPDPKSLKTLARRRNYFPFPFWNVRKPEFIEQQLTHAGPRLCHIPDIWRTAFGVTVAGPCAKAYVEHRERRLLKLCRELDEPGQIELTKVAYKNLLGKTAGMSDFKRDANAFELPQIIDILEGRVEEIDKTESKAVVLLRSLQGGLPFTEVFDLKMLEQANVNLIAQRFDYTVYKKAFGPVSAHVEPVYD